MVIHHSHGISKGWKDVPQFKKKKKACMLQQTELIQDISDLRLYFYFGL